MSAHHRFDRPLYSAYFLRSPDEEGWQYWTLVYGQQEAGLPTMSQSFANSAEFIATYGSLDNAAFVELVYRNVLGREPDRAGFDHWVESLDEGYPRGSVMIAFSESEEYVIRTDTTPPLAGYLQWYREPVMFSCGAGNDLATRHTTFEYADLLVVNVGDQATDWRWSLRNAWEYGDLWVTGPTLPPPSYTMSWNVAVQESHPGTWGLTFETGNRTEIRWMVVMHNEAHAPDRHPWGQLVEDSPN